jgi:predicted transcriptional regulator
MRTTVVRNLKTRRIQLRLSQSELARRSGVGRVRICHHELGDIALTEDEQKRILEALQCELDRLRSLPTSTDPDKVAQTAKSCPEKAT